MIEENENSEVLSLDEAMISAEADLDLPEEEEVETTTPSTTTDTTSETVETPEPEATEVETPETPTWVKAEDQEVYGSLDDGARAFVDAKMSQVEEVFKGLEEQVPRIEYNQQVAERVHQYGQAFGAEDPVAAMDHIVNIFHTAINGNEAEKVQALETFLGIAGITPELVDKGTKMPPPDPKVAQYEQQLSQYEQQLQHNEHAQYAQSVDNALAQFSSAVDKDGKLLFPYAGQVDNEMAAIAIADTQMGKEIDLPSIYERALWQNPTVRQKMIEQQNADRVAKARATDTTVRGTASGLNEGREVKSLDDAFDLALAQLA